MWRLGQIGDIVLQFYWLHPAYFQPWWSFPPLVFHSRASLVLVSSVTVICTVSPTGRFWVVDYSATLSTSTLQSAFQFQKCELSSFPIPAVLMSIYLWIDILFFGWSFGYWGRWIPGQQSWTWNFTFPPPPPSSSSSSF
jgi:hypothetical protein